MLVKKACIGADHANGMFFRQQRQRFFEKFHYATGRAAVRLVRLFKTAALACSRSGKRRTDFVVVRFPRECGFRFMTGSLHAADQ